MTIVKYPNMYDSFLTSFKEVLDLFYVSDQAERFKMGLEGVDVQPMDIDMTGVAFHSAPVNNTLAFSFLNYFGEDHLHCTLGDDQYSNQGFEKRMRFSMRVAVIVPSDSPLNPNHSGDYFSMKVYDNLNVIFDTQSKLFEARNIHDIKLSSPKPSEIIDNIHVRQGILKLEIRARYRKNLC